MEDAEKLIHELGETEPSQRIHVLRERVNELMENARAEALADKMAEREVDVSRQKKSVGPEEILAKFGYHKATPTTGPLHQLVRTEFIGLARTLNAILPEGRAKSVFFTELETASMWANKSIAEMAPVVDE